MFVTHIGQIDHLEKGFTVTIKKNKVKKCAVANYIIELAF